MEEQLNSMILVITYIILITVGMYSVYLYRKAYYQMKRTKVIKSVYFLLTTILIENIYFGLAAVCKHLDIIHYEIFMHPLLWMVPKILLLFGICYFINASLSENKYNPDCD